ncbi:MAG: hypothetical protein CMB85_04240 [Flammeovirgaceae bacterium]|nr:hypothetical protein [Flammeovirgaceae bacterium]|tara:strand:- start:1539 stop:2264 length:726 start_codon:yes stop_codon:yes gene_type:complete
MKKYLAEGLVIFASIFASFSVENIRQDSIEKDILNEAVITLGDEIESNIDYTKEHLKQVENMLYLTNELLNRYDDIKLTNLYEIHSNNPFIYNIINNGELEYIKKYNDQYNIMSYWNAWEPEDVFFQSMLYSGKLLEIKNKKLRKEIESIYTKHEERVSGMTNYTRNNSDKIMSWFEDGKNNFDRDILNEELFNAYKDQELKNLLKFRSDNLTGRVNNLENYLQALNNVVLLISSEYKKLD